MPFGWLAGGAILGGGLQALGSMSAADKQAAAANNATASQGAMFGTLNNQQAPYRDAGYASLSKLGQLLGTSPQTFGPSTPYNGAAPLSKSQFDPKAYLDAYGDVAANPNQAGDPFSAYMSEGAKVGSYRPAFQLDTTPPAGGAPGGSAAGGDYGSLLHTFNASDLNSNLAPNYQFQLEQGLGATQNMLNKSGGLISGNSLRGINDYAQGMAGNAYQQAFENYTTNQNNIYNRLSNIAGLGQTANQTSAQAGTSLGSGIANSMMNAGAASAGGQVGTANALAGGLNNAGTWYALSSLMKPQTGLQGIG